MADKKLSSIVPTSFCGDDDHAYPVYDKERKFIQRRRKNMTGSCKSDELQPFPTTKNNMVGLCLSGGGIRSATFNLGLLQALYRCHILQRVDYLSTVSGGGYIGSCLTALLNSGTTAPSMAPDHLWKRENFPFSKPVLKPANGGAGKTPPNQSGSGAPLTGGGGSAEKVPVRRLRYFSNYLTAEGNLIQKYLGPMMAFTRGLIFNFLLILPFILLAATLLVSLYQIPEYSVGPLQIREFKMGPYQINSSRQALKAALKLQQQAEADYEAFVFRETRQFNLLDMAEREEIVRQNPDLREARKALRQNIDDADERVRAQWWAMLTIPLAALAMMMIAAYIYLLCKQSDLKCRFKFSHLFSWVLFFSLIALAIQAFGAAIVYWGHFLPNKLAFISLLTFIGPQLLKKRAASADTGQQPWVKILLSILLMALTPLILLYLTGWCVNVLMGESGILFNAFEWTNVLWGFGAGGALLVITNRWLNINKISLHHFYRDRLCRAFILQDNRSDFSSIQPFDTIELNDTIKLSKLYDEATPHTGPYHIINANLNLKKSLPKDANMNSGIFRKGESFIFSKFWCGSKETDYIETEAYEHADPHLNLGTAMAISGAAANIGMGQGDVPTLRLLLGLMNIRLGYWALNPRQPKSWGSKLLFGNAPGALSALCEWFGQYPRDGKFVNLSDGGHFDNIGVYELLRRRCKYIIVSDAEADAQMKFQALAYLIRLARIDFGIHIDIDISNLKLDADTNVSGQHCVVGTIDYPAGASIKAETGYLLYCKSSLTGDEPAHLYEYRVKHPSFPHQTTADQWFDEQQFEVYRELGYHIGKVCFSAVDKIKADTSMENLFNQIKEFWHPRSIAIEGHFTQHAAELNRIFADIKDDPHLSFMDAQMYPEWATLMNDSTPSPQVDLWLPKGAKERRAGFYSCIRMIQLMENVYHDLNLEEQHEHPDNRGWMNLFMHWAWAGIFRVTWAISACTYGAKFQRFCERRLGMDGGRVSVEILGSKINGQTGEKEKTQARPPGPLAANDLMAVIEQHLNPFEIKEAAKHLAAYGEVPRHCYGFYLTVQNPLAQAGGIRFCFGFALTVASKDTIQIDYFRVQDHLRQMGLGRQAMEKFVAKILHDRKAETNIDDPARERQRLESIALAPWIEQRPDLEQEKEKVHNLLASVITEISTSF